MTTPSNRSCGECTACCTTHGVPSVQKDACSPCEHCVVNEGCTIYEHRPKRCREFKCQWLSGRGSEEERPDRCGIVLDYIALDDGGEKQAVLLEYKEHALRSSYAHALITHFMKKGITTVSVAINKDMRIYPPLP